MLVTSELLIGKTKKYKSVLFGQDKIYDSYCVKAFTQLLQLSVLKGTTNLFKVEISP